MTLPANIATIHDGARTLRFTPPFPVTYHKLAGSPTVRAGSVELGLSFLGVDAQEAYDGLAAMILHHSGDGDSTAGRLIQARLHIETPITGESHD